MPPIARTLRHSALATLVLLAACAANEDDHFVRGHKLRVASMSADARVAVYRSALGAAFDLRDPALTLLLDRRKLPRIGGMAEEGRLSGPVANGLRERGVVQGDCEPPITTSRKTPVCTARGPGYVVRFSDVLARGGDSVEVYLAVQKFDTPGSGANESLRFERAYQLVRHGDRFDPTQEARVRETAPPPDAPQTPTGAPAKP
jgi:hypothetical protein